MRSHPRYHRWARQLVLGGAAFLPLSALPLTVSAADPPAIASPAPALDLASCRQIALEKQPALAAYRGSLAAAQAKAAALENLHVPTILRPDLPIRRKQACIGVGIQQAMYQQQEAETIYSVTRTYLSVLYAQEQTRLAKDLLKTLEDLQETTKGLAGQKDTSVTLVQADRVQALLEVARSRQQEASSGVERALAALREAMGVGCDFPLQVATHPLTAGPVDLTKEQVVCLALERRFEIVQTCSAAQVAALEIKAQGAARGRTAQTFAAGADIHAQPVPQGLRNGDYRPGGIGLDYPIQLVGSCAERVQQAQALGSRADAVCEKTRNLVTLEAQDVYYRYLDWANRAPRLAEAARLAEKRSDAISKLFEPRVAKPRALLDEVLDASFMTTTLRVQANEADFRYLLILADLERVTAGGFCPTYLPRPAP